MLKKDFNKIGRVKWKKVGGRGEGFPRTDFRKNERLFTYLSKSVNPSL